MILAVGGRRIRSVTPVAMHESGVFIITRAKHIEALAKDDRLRATTTEFPQMMDFPEGDCPSSQRGPNSRQWPGTRGISVEEATQGAAMHAIRIDRDKPLAAEPHSGHNRYHPDIAPVVEIGEGEEIALETRDALDGQIKPGMVAADLASLDAGAVHPLTGPVFVKGAMPGDILEIEFTDIMNSTMLP